METWESIAGWIKKVYGDDLFKQSAQLIGQRLSVEKESWRQFCLVPVDYLQIQTGKIDDKIFQSMSAFLMYHWDAGHTAGLSLVNALCGGYNAAFTLLRSFTELLINGALFQCLAQKTLRESPAFEATHSLSLLASQLSSLLKQNRLDPAALETASASIFDLMKGDWMQSAFRIDIGSKIQQLTDWAILKGLDEPRIVRKLYGRLSENVHQRIEHTDIGRAIEEGEEIFEWPPKILAESLNDFLGEFHLAIDIGVVVELNLLVQKLPRDRLREKDLQLLNNQDFRTANLKQAKRLLKNLRT